MFTTLVVQVTFNLCTLFTGLSHAPRPEKSEISFSLSDEKSYAAYVTHIGQFLSAYDDEQQKDNSIFEDCDCTYFYVHLELFTFQ